MNCLMLYLIKCRWQFMSFGSTLRSGSLRLLLVQALLIIPSQSWLFIYISSYMKFRFLLRGSPFIRRTRGEWSDPNESSLVHTASGRFSPHREVINWQSSLSYTFSSPLQLFDHKKYCPFTPKSFIFMSSIISLKASIKRCDFLIPSLSLDVSKCHWSL